MLKKSRLTAKMNFDNTRFTNTIWRATLSGSFKRDLDGLQDAYNELVTCGVQVLSPHRLNFDGNEDFVRDTAESGYSAYELERHHLLSIAQSEFLWVHAPQGRIGVSTAFEIGYALASNTPVFCREDITDIGLQKFVQQASSVYAVLRKLSSVR